MQLALYTTVYPGVLPFLFSWYGSVQNQTDRDFDLWIGIDGLEVREAVKAIGAKPAATWVGAEQGDSPAQIRQKAIRQMVEQYGAVVFVDSDDVLAPTRLEAARRSLDGSDVNGCAMRIVDETGNDLPGVFKPPADVPIETILPHHNVYGLTNSAYRSQLLQRCLPFPDECTLVDWFLITCAWAHDARLSFDFSCRMAYRQHFDNLCRVASPFESSQILQATELVLNHYDCVLSGIAWPRREQKNQIESARDRVNLFHQAITSSPDILDLYVVALNQLPSVDIVWWQCVAHRQLEKIWKRN